MTSKKEKEQGYEDRHIVPALWATIWILTSLTILVSGILGVLIGRMSL